MIVYKITNMINGKVYIGQTSKTVEERFKEHCENAFKYNMNFIFSHALRKYGKDNFKLEVLENNLTQEEANFFEKFYIKKFRSSEHDFGYNMTLGGEGGDTFLAKTKEEMDIIGNKISEHLSFGKNPNAHSFKMKDLKTNEIMNFGSCSECYEYFIKNFPEFKLEKNQRPGLDQINEVKKFEVQTPLFNRFIFANLNDDFPSYSFTKRKKGAHSWKVFENGKEVFCSNSLSELQSFLGTSYKKGSVKRIIEAGKKKNLEVKATGIFRRRK